MLQRDHRDYGDVDGAFAGADRVVRERFVQHRYSNQPMETRGCVADVDRLAGTVQYHSATQNTHLLKWSLAALTGRQPVWQSLVQIVRQRDRMAELAKRAKALGEANKAASGAKGSALEEPIGEGLSAPVSPGRTMAQTFLREPIRIVHLTRMLLGLLARDPVTLPRVTAQDVGGAFGVKVLPTREDVAVLAAAVDLGRSVKWIEDRNEHLLIAGQAREETLEVEAALREDGTLLGMRVHMSMDQGAYPAFPFSAAMYPLMIRTMIPGPYRLPALGFSTTLTASNKATYVAYRGPWAVETWCASGCSTSPHASWASVATRSASATWSVPTSCHGGCSTGPTLDVRMSARTTLERALELADLEHWPAAADRGARRGADPRPRVRHVHRGGAGTTRLPGGGDAGGRRDAGGEPARAVLEADGTVSVYTQQMPHGQGHETTLAQVAADELGLPLGQVRVRYGDTSITPFGLAGTGGSRSAPMAGGAVTYSARALRERIVERAADLLEAPKEDLVVEDGAIHVQGVPAISVSFVDVAANAGHAARRRGVRRRGRWLGAGHARVLGRGRPGDRTGARRPLRRG